MLTCLTGTPRIAPGEILVVGCLRNEALRLPYFLAHHRRLGVTRFLLIDNGSEDGSRALLRDQPDVTLFHTDQPYSDSRCGVDWQNAVLAEHARGHWVLVLDADEMFVFPGCETTGLDRFTGHLEETGADAVAAPMIDMYADRPLAETGYAAGEDLLACCPWFDAGGYQLGGPNSPVAGLPVRGGPRKRLFWDARRDDFPAPVLHKIPLMLWRADRALEASTHVLAGARLARTTGALLHFKMLQDFAATARREALRGEHFAGARQYRAYDDVLAQEAGLTALCDLSVRYEDSAQLCRLGLMRTGPGYPFLPPQGTG